MNKNISEYKVGDELFRYVNMAGVFKYTVKGRREYEGSVQLEVVCNTCSHGWQCELLLAKNDYDKIVHVHMLNDDESNSQRYWHTNDGLHFWPTPGQAKDEKLHKLVKDAEERVRKSEEGLKAAKKQLAEFKGMIEGVQP